MTGNNKYGRAGRRGVLAATFVAFLDHYTTHDGPTLINGHRVTPIEQRIIRRWRNGHVEHVSIVVATRWLVRFGFDLPWFHGWAKMHRKPLT